MFQRFLITYAILTVGFTFISFGMMFNGSDYPGNPAWPFVTGIRNFFLLVGLTVGGGVGLLEFFATSSETERAKEAKEREGLPKVATEAELNADQAAHEARKKARMEREQESRKAVEIQAREQEEARLRQEQLKRQAEEKRKKRTAEEAANTGLDDFL